MNKPLNTHWICIKRRSLEVLKLIAEDKGWQLQDTSLPVAGEPGWCDIEVDEEVYQALRSISEDLDVAILTIVEKGGLPNIQ